MLRQVVVCITLVLLVSASAQGSIDQWQGFSIGTGEAIHLAQGEQTAHWSQNLTIDMTQEGDGGSGLMLASAYALGSTRQIGIGGGLTGLLGVSRVRAASTLGAGTLLMPSAGGANALLARARLNSLLLQAN